MQRSTIQRQQGFTLLELLVVITLLAVLAVGALVAYEGATDKASSTASANNISTADRALRQTAAIQNGKFPGQWDTIVAQTGNEPCWDGQKDTTTEPRTGTFGDCTGGEYQRLLSNATRSILVKLDIAAANGGDADFSDALESAFGAVGLGEVQSLSSAAIATNVNSSLAYNESGNGNADEWEIDDAVANAGVVKYLYAYPSGAAGTCTAAGQNLRQPLAGTAATNSSALNKFTDRLESDGCHLVVVLGLGHDVGGQGGGVGFATVPTYTSATVNPAYNYARYLGLFHVATASNGTNVTAADIAAQGKPRLIAVIDPEGKGADAALNASFTN